MDFEEMVSVIWKSKWIIILTAVIAFGFALFFAMQQETTYTAEALLVVGNLASDPRPGQSAELAMSYAELANTKEVLEAAAESSDTGASQSELGGVSATANSESPYIRLSAVDGEEQSAISKANTVAEGLIVFVDQLQSESNENDKQAITDELADIENEIVAIRLSPNADLGRLAALEAIRESLISQYESLNLESVSSGKLTVVSPAESAAKNSPSPWRSAFVALVVGGAIGTLLGFLVQAIRKALLREGGSWTF